MNLRNEDRNRDTLPLQEVSLVLTLMLVGRTCLRENP